MDLGVGPLDPPFTLGLLLVFLKNNKSQYSDYLIENLKNSDLDGDYFVIFMGKK